MFADIGQTWFCQHKTWHNATILQEDNLRYSVVKNKIAVIEKYFHCPKCQKPYSRQSTLLRHLKRECGKDPEFQCPECTYQTKQKSNLSRHMSRHRK